MTPTKPLLAGLVSIAVLLAGCAGNDEGEPAEGQDAGDENADLYQEGAAPQPSENIPGDAAENDTTTTDGNAIGTSG